MENLTGQGKAQGAKSQHTTGDWIAHSNGVIEAPRRMVCKMIGDDTGTGHNKITPEDIANAQRIVNAVNFFNSLPQQIVELERDVDTHIVCKELKEAEEKLAKIKFLQELLNQSESK